MTVTLSLASDRAIWYCLWRPSVFSFCQDEILWLHNLVFKRWMYALLEKGFKVGRHGENIKLFVKRYSLSYLIDCSILWPFVWMMEYPLDRHWFFSFPFVFFLSFCCFVYLIIVFNYCYMEVKWFRNLVENCSSSSMMSTFLLINSGLLAGLGSLAESSCIFNLSNFLFFCLLFSSVLL